MNEHSIARAMVLIIIKTKPLWMPLVITSLQVQDLIYCFPDEDSHLMKFCLHRPTFMTVGGLLALLQCPLLQTGKEWASSVSVYVHVHACIHSDLEH